MHGIAELLGGRRIRVVGAQIRVVRFVAVRAPVALVLAGVGVEDDDAMVAVAVGNVDFIGLLVDESFGGQAEILHVVAALAVVGLADLHQKFSVLRKFQDHVVVVGGGAGGDVFAVLRVGGGCRSRWRGARGRSAAAVAANPDVTFVIDGDAVIGIGPIVAWARAAPVVDEIACFVELENGRRGS